MKDFMVSFLSGVPAGCVHMHKPGQLSNACTISDHENEETQTPLTYGHVPKLPITGTTPQTPAALGSHHATFIVTSDNITSVSPRIDNHHVPWLGLHHTHVG